MTAQTPAPPAPYDLAAELPGTAVAAPARRNGLAITSLVAGLVAFALGAIPVVNILALVAGVAAIAVGVVVLRRRPTEGKGLAIAGISLGALGTLTAALVLVVLGALFTTGSALESEFGEGFTEVVIEEN
jgi:hypothetical protein